MSFRPDPPLLDALALLARQAGEAILEVYAQDFAVEHKGDDSPVTEADRRAEAVILPGLMTLAPDIPIVSEEQASTGVIPAVSAAGPFWLVDPLDGTKEFVRRNGEFTVNIGLIQDGRPIAGVVHAPVPDRMFAGLVGWGAWTEEAGRRRAIAARTPPAEGLVMFDSRSHRTPEAMADFAARHRIAEVRNAGSSLKFCLIAASEGDVYPRFGPTSEWDTAAGQAVLEAAGGRVTDLEGWPLRYAKPGLHNSGFLAWGAQPNGG